MAVVSQEALASQLKPFRMSFPVWLSVLVAVSVGAISFYFVASSDPTRAWFNLVVGTGMFTGFGLFGFFMLALNNLVEARWHIVHRRVYEAMALTLPVSAIFTALVFFGRHEIYEWTHLDYVAKDPILLGKASYLDESFFGVRMIAYYLVWIFGSIFLVVNSNKQDKSGDVKYTLRNRRAAPILVVLFALSISGYAFDLLMSLEPHWFSTIYGVYYFAMIFQAGLAMSCLIVWHLKKPGYLEGIVNQKHLHDLGKFVFAFSIFWAYIAFSQFMLYWYADLAEEILFYRHRMDGSFGLIGLGTLLLRWLIPFLVLMPFFSKNTPKIIVPVCVLVLYGHWMDLFWNVMPASRLMYHSHGHEVAHHATGYQWLDVASGAGFIGLFILVFGVILQGIRLVPTRDPRLGDSMHHH